MRRSCLPGILVLAILAVVGIYMLSRRGERLEAEVTAGGAWPAVAASDSSRPIGAAPSRPFAPAGAERKGGGAPEADGDDALRRELEEARVELERISRPLHEDVRSATVNAEVEEGEALVTGGYRTADGNYELTFLTPKTITLEDGREAIEISADVVSVGVDFVADSGLETLATNARNTLQHAEAWRHEEATATLGLIGEYESSERLSAPRAIVLPGQAFSVQMGTRVPVPAPRGGVEFKDFGYTLEGTVARSEDGSGFSIRSRVERVEQGAE